ncbi:hypothetical protein U879_12355 [Defluviimonas sp. 20V17]|uniref:O-antigen ligase-related domain-containing protein n=1 Tax=Allgaiera indica TaxID=765699 RepID=A0AAN4UNB6_9RHOB|nr:O-antigen ligase family protein [Allgaiera indica]KDB03367.1 hypothetical protein U879_12355 [Defluviimonas sp. 20V17]GHD98577.1 hypothetical protein GCM10008024_02650 [Allgaiera indica]SDW10567.1 hypothetical protein SAMN05444006_101282 [Allgaiera indica]
MPNTFSYVALFLWPVVVFFLYRSLPRDRALIASILGGYLLLPFGVGINLPVLPTYDKTLVPVLSALIMAMLVPAPPERATARGSATVADRAGRTPFTRQRETLARRQTHLQTQKAGPGETTGSGGNRISNMFLVLLFVTPFVSVLTNSQPVDIGPRVLPGLRLYDAFSFALTSLISVLPFLMARRYLATQRAHKYLLIGLVLWGLFYTLPALYEIRMSPQLARRIYGFLAQQFVQAMRDGGFRPVVFLQHGLWLAIYFAMAILAAAALWRTCRAEGDRKAPRWLFALVWLLGTLILAKSLGALAVALVLLPVALLFSPRAQVVATAIIAAVILTYPALRHADLIPVNRFVAAAESYSPERARSLEFRLVNEDRLLAHARQKPLAGWGGWGRGRVYSEHGRDISVTDGMWIIVMSDSGWLGYIANFGLLTIPIFLIALRRRGSGLPPATVGLSVVLTANLIDMIPNATLTPVTWMIAGALTGWLARREAAKAPPEGPPARRAPPRPPTRATA